MYNMLRFNYLLFRYKQSWTTYVSTCSWTNCW